MRFEEEKYYSSIRSPVTSAVTLNPESYHSKEFFDKEREKVFANSWVCVGYTSQVPKQGSVLPVMVGGDPVLICRNSENKIVAFQNTCRHRGSLLIEKETCVDRIRCPYHSWTYDLNGNLQHCPLFESDASAPLNKGEFGLFSLRCETWGCFIFVSLSSDPLPIKEYLGDLLRDYHGFPLEELVLVKRKHYTIQANWKLVAENFLEYYHLPWVHPELCRVTAIEKHQRNQGRGMYMSFFASPLLPGNTPLDAGYLPAMPGLSSQQETSGYFPLIFPNVAMFLMPHHLFSLLMMPTKEGVTQEWGDILVHPSVIEEPDFDKKLDEIFSFYDMVNKQDIKAVELVQRGVQGRLYKGGRMTYRFEEPLHRFQNILAGYMVGNICIPEGDSFPCIPAKDL